jgi:hypothetical protein
MIVGVARERAGTVLPGQLRDGRGNGNSTPARLPRWGPRSCRGLSVARQVRDLPGFLALPLPFPD